LEESKEIIIFTKKYGIDLIFLIAPTSSLERIKKISRISRGFIYYVSLTGITGIREGLVNEVGHFVNKIKMFTKKPVCVGFGVSTKEQVKEILKYSDGVIVGSAIVKKFEEGRDEKDIVKKTAEFVKILVSSAREK
jgi:tryptophan synthase alpha chain